MVLLQPRVHTVAQSHKDRPGPVFEVLTGSNDSIVDRIINFC